jgi:hypothetical protein
LDFLVGQSGALSVLLVLLVVVLAHNLLRLTGQLQDMHPGARPVCDVYQASIVELDVVGLDRVLAIDSVAADDKAVGNRVLVRRRDEIGDRRGVARVTNIPNPDTGVEPADDRQLAVIRPVERLAGGVGPEPPALVAEISRVARDG